MKNNGLRALMFLVLAVMGMQVTAQGLEEQLHVVHVGQRQTLSTCRVLVAYFSLTGQTEKMAQYIAECTGGDLYRIEPEEAYPTEENALVQRGKRELADRKPVAIKSCKLRLEEYDVVFVGSPVWFSDWTAPAIAFAHDRRLIGKRVIPFMTGGRDVSDVPDLFYGKYSQAAPEKGLYLKDKNVERGGMNAVMELICDIMKTRKMGNFTLLGVANSIVRMQRCYPKMTLCDVYKSFYQDYFGPGHIIESKSKATNYIKKEMQQVDGVSIGYRGAGVEMCGAKGRYVRVDLNMVKNGEIAMKDYVDMLMRSVKTDIDAAGWLEEWNVVVTAILEYGLQIDNFDADIALINTRIAEGNYGMHHSEVFDQCYKPHYRIIKRELFENRKIALTNKK